MNRFLRSRACMLVHACAAASLLLPAPPAARGEPVTMTVIAFLGSYVAGKILDEFVDPLTGKPDTRELQRQLDRLATSDAAHAAAIRDLKRSIAGCATKEEVRQQMKNALERIDQRAAEHAERIYELERQQQRLWAEVGLNGRDMDAIKAHLRKPREEPSSRLHLQQKQLDGHDFRLARAEADIDEIKRWTPKQQAVQLGVAGFQAMRQGDCKEAIALFRKANAYDDRDPGFLYGLAMAYRQAGDLDRAEHAVTRGISLERQRSPGAWFVTVLEREQSNCGRWLRSARNDPIHGVRASGEIRVQAASRTP